MSHSKLWRDRRGVAATEFAIIAPVFILIYVVGADVGFLMRNRFRVDQAAVQGLQVAAQFNSFYKDDFTTTIFPVIQTIAGNGSSKSSTDTTQVACAATVSGLDYPTTGDRNGLLSIVWQESYTNGVCTASRVGAFDNTTKTPIAPALNNYAPPSGVPFIVVEVASKYNLIGMSANALGPSQLQYSVAMAIPRQRVLPPIIQGSRP